MHGVQNWKALARVRLSGADLYLRHMLSSVD